MVIELLYFLPLVSVVVEAFRNVVFCWTGESAYPTVLLIYCPILIRILSAADPARQHGQSDSQPVDGPNPSGGAFFKGNCAQSAAL